MVRFRFLAPLVLVAAPVLAGGSITGVVNYSGPAPKQDKIDRKADPVCSKSDSFDDSVLLSKDGKALQNVVLRLKNGPAGTAPAGPVTVDQDGCLYKPRVQGAVAGQKIEIRNADATLHNVHGYQGPKTVFNQAQPPKTAPISKAVTDPDVVKLKCDVHSWMVSYVVFSKNPYFATSGADGRFEIKDVPPGKYTVEAWHEKLGTKTAEVTVEEGKAADLPVAFAAN
ncbi:MAG: carboxypeptidase regulatory-like domain-containing protein [Myxococcales bacterium]|nr:carboxypeptidase regulatory-like domain-containing protein [Myxococcales bacterium]